MVLSAAVAQGLPGQIGSIGVDSSQTSIPLDEILSGGPPPNGIPALGFDADWQGASESTPEPSFVSQDEAADWLGAQEPVIVVELNGEARAYPLQILTWHEITNDTLGGVPVAVTFCPLCNSALAFDRRIPLSEDALAEVSAANEAIEATELDETFLSTYAAQGNDADIMTGVEVTFGVSGALYNSNMLMFDNKTSTLWSQLLGNGAVGALTDSQLLRYAAPIISFEAFRAAYPDALVQSKDTGFRRDYGRNPYVGYDDANSPAFLFQGESDGRLAPKERVVSVIAPEESVAYPFTILAAQNVVNDKVGEQPVAVFWRAGTASALDAGTIDGSRDVGAANIFSRELDGQTLTFEWNGDTFTDAETGSSWNILGQATAGELAGSQLEPVVHDNTLWFAWAAFKPGTRIYTN